MRRATVTIHVEREPTHETYAYSTYGRDEEGIVDVTLTERCSTDLDVARLLKRLAYMIHPKVDEPAR